MIRFHEPVFANSSSWLVAPSAFLLRRMRNMGWLQVSARRKPRGHIIPSSEVREVCRNSTTTHIEWTTETVEGWRPLGFNGRTGEIFPTRLEAAKALLSDHRFD